MGKHVRMLVLVNVEKKDVVIAVDAIVVVVHATADLSRIFLFSS